MGVAPARARLHRSRKTEKADERSAAPMAKITYIEHNGTEHVVDVKRAG